MRYDIGDIGLSRIISPSEILLIHAISIVFSDSLDLKFCKFCYAASSGIDSVGNWLQVFWITASSISALMV